jgi:hypothetical protein
LIVFIVYSFILLGLIYYNGFFKLFNDPDISKKKFAFLFLGKIISVPVFLLVYTRIYGGIGNFDTGKFYNDVLSIYKFAKTDLNFLARILFGLQDDSPGSFDFEHAFKNTVNWDNGTVKDYLYNDNRVLIRIHLLLNFISFNSYPVHALFNCFLSFTGISFLYKAFKEWFADKEIQVLVILCFFPSLWFYTGALLKEGITFFVLGCTIYQLKKVVYGGSGLINICWLLFLLFLSLLLKPYILVFSAFCFSTFFIIYRSERIQRKIFFFFFIMASLLFLVNTVSVLVKHKSLLGAALQHQHRFIGVSRGGIFLTDSVKFIRLTNDTSQVKRVQGKKDLFTIHKNVPYMFWETTEQKDTLYCHSNKDTSTCYQLVYIINESHSNLEISHPNPFYTLANCFYYTLFYPDFFNAKNVLQVLASFENLAVLISLLIIIFGLAKSKKEKFPAVVFIFFALSLCLLIGLTAPNSGAIFRYRSPAMIFLLLAALYFIKGPGNIKKSDS